MLKRLFSIAIFVILLAIASDVLAQCPMCKMTAESNMKDGGTAGLGLNAGILYMLATPYLLLGTFAWLWWRNKQQRREWEEAED
jgi:hypothetical protein